MRLFAVLSLALVLLFPLIGLAQTQLPADSSSPLQFKLKKEPRFYLTIHGGYSVALGSTFKFYPDNVSSIAVKSVAGGAPVQSTSYTATSKGLGEGTRFGAGLSYILNDFINVGLDFDYLSTSISRNRDSSYTETDASGAMTYGFKQQYKISYNAKLITVTPNVTFKAISRPRFFIYNKLGAVLVFRPNSIQYETQNSSIQRASQGSMTDSSSENSRRYEWGIRNPAFGFMGAIGTQIKITEKIRGYFEAQFTHVVFAVRNRILTNYNVDGREMVDNLPMSEKTIIFEDSYTESGQGSGQDAPVVAARQRFPISYVGFQIGIAYRF